MGIPPQATLAELYHEDRWELRAARSDKQVQVQCILSNTLLTNEPDCYEWEVEGKTWLKYSTGETYRLLKVHQPAVAWYKAVWSKSGIPKHNFQA